MTSPLRPSKPLRMSTGSRPTKMRTEGEGGKLSIRKGPRSRAVGRPHRSQAERAGGGRQPGPARSARCSWACTARRPGRGRGACAHPISGAGRCRLPGRQSAFTGEGSGAEAARSQVCEMLIHGRRSGGGRGVGRGRCGHAPRMRARNGHNKMGSPDVYSTAVFDPTGTVPTFSAARIPPARADLHDQALRLEVEATHNEGLDAKEDSEYGRGAHGGVLVDGFRHPDSGALALRINPPLQNSPKRPRTARSAPGSGAKASTKGAVEPSSSTCSDCLPPESAIFRKSRKRWAQQTASGSRESRSSPTNDQRSEFP